MTMTEAGEAVVAAARDMVQRGMNAQQEVDQILDPGALPGMAAQDMTITLTEHQRIVALQRETIYRNVCEVARKYARENDWCSVVETALKEAGVWVEDTGSVLYKTRRRVTVVTTTVGYIELSDRQVDEGVEAVDQDDLGVEQVFVDDNDPDDSYKEQQDLEDVTSSTKVMVDTL